MNNVILIQEQKLSYKIVPSKRIGETEFSQFQDLLFDFWQQQWDKEFNKSGAPKKGWEDHFLRQDVITGVFYDNEVIACHLYTFYNLKAHSTFSSEYFEYINDQSRAYLKAKYNDAMSMEYLCVDEKWKYNSLKVGFGKVILSLGSYLAEAYGADCALGMPIYGNKVDKMMENVGAYDLQDPIEKYGYKLKLMVAPTKPRLPSLDVNTKNVCDYLWERRTDYKLHSGRMAI